MSATPAAEVRAGHSHGEEPLAHVEGRQGAGRIGQHGERVVEEAEEATEEDTLPPNELRRYNFYVDGDAAAAAVLPLPETWMTRLTRRVPPPTTNEQRTQLQAMQAEARQDFCRAARVALLEYLLLSPSEVSRLGLPTAAAWLARARRARAVSKWPLRECRAPVTWHARVRHAAARLKPALVKLQPVCVWCVSFDLKGVRAHGPRFVTRREKTALSLRRNKNATNNLGEVLGV